MRRYEDLTPEERTICELAIGRVLRMGSRPAQPGDGAEFDRCARILKDIHGADECRGYGAPLPGWNFGRGNTGRIE